jgi:hypothetical protein
MRVLIAEDDQVLADGLLRSLRNAGYALSYQLQKNIEKLPPARKPHLMLAGHWHVFCHLFVRDVVAIACPTFQSGANAFGRSLGGSPAIGGLILRWQMTEQRTMRNFRVETCWYYDHEMVQVIEGAP